MRHECCLTVELGEDRFVNRGRFVRQSFRNALGALTLGLGLATLPQAATATPVFNVSGGIFAGISDIVIGGQFYDVSFADGTCAGVFGACDPAHFQFNSDLDAIIASSFLSDTLVDYIAVFHTFPGLIPGCLFPSRCTMQTPYDVVSTLVSVAGVSFLSGSPLVFTGDFPASMDSSESDRITWAIWSPTSSSVPEPASGTLLGAGLLAFVFIRQRFKRKREVAE